MVVFDPKLWHEPVNTAQTTGVQTSDDHKINASTEDKGQHTSARWDSSQNIDEEGCLGVFQKQPV
jgi:hypothetical protein